MKWDAETYRLSGTGNLTRICLIIGLIGVAASAAGFAVDRSQFFHSWLVAFVFWFTLAAGGLFFTMLHHLTASTWSVVVRRLSEILMTVLPFMFIAFLPLLFGLHELYHWTHSEAVMNDSLLQWKSAFLNVPFFLIRVVIYFGVWFLLSRMLMRVSLQQDSGHTADIKKRMGRISALGMILFAFTMTFAAFDWLMSLDPHWYSTIFGVYIFAGAMSAFFAFMALLAAFLRRKGVLTNLITKEHYNDLGKLLFAFLIFWAYMAFSQYFLIWYGNIPEETIWFRHRWVGSWKAMTLLLVFGHFVIPFFILIVRAVKRNLILLGLLAAWILFMHFIDLHWVTMPTLHHHGVHVSWIDIATVVAIGGLFMALLFSKLSKHPLVPVGDPKLEISGKSISH